MNLIDFTVTKICTEPVKNVWPDITYWTMLVEYKDEGGDGYKQLSAKTEEELMGVKVGYVGQH